VSGLREESAVDNGLRSVGTLVGSSHHLVLLFSAAIGEDDIVYCVDCRER
jgi:hypothetical protein